MRRVAIFTAKSTETEAVKAQLLGPIGKQRTAQTYVYDVYNLKKDVAGDQPVNDVEVALYETGRGQEKVMPAVPPIVGDFDPHLILYIGCAGGDPNETEVYDVFIPTHAWPYEKGKETKDGFQSRAYPLEPDGYLYDLSKAVATRPKWRTRIPPAFRVDAVGRQIESKVKHGMLASGNKVLADDEGEVWKAAKGINDEIIAVETECFAFFKSMEPLHRPYLMIRGISDLLANKNAGGTQLDHDRQTRSTARAAALAAQLILEANDAVLRQSRGAGLPSWAGKLVGYWMCDWDYASEKCQELLHIERIDASGRVSGRRVSKMPQHKYAYDVTGVLSGDRLHLTAIPTGQNIPISVSLVLRIAGNFADLLTGIAIRPLGNPPTPELGPNVLIYGDELWASIVKYARVGDPAIGAAELWKIYQESF